MDWIIVALILIFGAALILRVRSARASSPHRSQPSEPIFPTIPPLEPGEQYDTAVKLATVPNGPLADLWCQRLREQGIEAFYKPAAYLTSMYSGTSTNTGLPAEIWVGEHNAERARQLFPELG